MRGSAAPVIDGERDEGTNLKRSVEGTSFTYSDRISIGIDS
jgi:hypothetical protein